MLQDPDGHGFPRCEWEPTMRIGWSNTLLAVLVAAAAGACLGGGGSSKDTGDRLDTASWTGGDDSGGRGRDSSGEAGGGSGDGGSGDGGSSDGGSGDGGSGDDDAGDGDAGDGGSGDGGSGDGGSDGPIDLTVDALAPDYGSNAGGDLVTITGGPFDESVSVEIAGAAATVTSITETELVVVTPEVSDTGLSAVDVTVDRGSASLSDAFRYWDDAAGQYGMMGIVELTRYTGTYWSGGAPDDLLSAAVYFSEPTGVRWYELFTPTLDTCRSETWTGMPSVTTFDPGVSQIELEPTSGSTAQLSFDGTGFLGEPTSLIAGASYDLLAPGGILPMEDVESVLRLPSTGPVVSSPNLSSSMPPYISQYQDFSWTASGADWVLISMSIQNGATADGFEVVNCAVSDDGAFVFDGSQFSLWTSNAVAYISVGFVYDQSTTALPWNRGTSGIAGVVATLGGGFTL
ncbi:MAG: hypothetical protein CL927_03005 [Deltaproteobacteria bacterium]|nr:hypothetical protein [Deltaproteobacteria bacterium]HCH66650.1 hypothetical protein [Deltaproteobacteria bacterium]